MENVFTFDLVLAIRNNPKRLSPLLACANSILRDRNWAKEAVHDALNDLVGKPMTNVRKLDNYIYTCVRNHCNQECRKRSPWASIEGNDVPDVPDQPIRLSCAMKIFPEIMHLLQDELTEEQYKMFEQWVNLDSYKKIAENMGMTVTAVGSCLNRAKIKAQALADRIGFMLDELEQ